MKVCAKASEVIKGSGPEGKIRSKRDGGSKGV